MIKNRIQDSELAITPTKQTGSVPPKTTRDLPTRHDGEQPYNPDIRMATAKGYTFSEDVRMETAKGGTTLKQAGLQSWERHLIESSEVKRKATVAQLCK
jgi:hypothetical protein